MSVALYGPPGVGKSQIAIEYMYRNYGEYPVIIWMDGSDHLVLIPVRPTCAADRHRARQW